MTIAKKPKQNISDIVPNSDNKAKTFIEGANSSSEITPRQNKQPIMVRFDPMLLEKVDEASRHRGVSRSSWIQYVISRALDHGEG